MGYEQNEPTLTCVIAACSLDCLLRSECAETPECEHTPEIEVLGGNTWLVSRVGSGGQVVKEGGNRKIALLSSLQNFKHLDNFFTVLLYFQMQKKYIIAISFIASPCPCPVLDSGPGNHIIPVPVPVTAPDQSWFRSIKPVLVPVYSCSGS